MSVLESDALGEASLAMASIGMSSLAFGRQYRPTVEYNRFGQGRMRRLGMKLQDRSERSHYLHDLQDSFCKFQSSESEGLLTSDIVES
jgi:hypothetical protein